MAKRFVSVWFRHLLTDWYTRRNPDLIDKPFVLYAKNRGRLVVKASNFKAEQAGIEVGMVLADARTLEPSIEAIEEPAELTDIFESLFEEYRKEILQSQLLMAEGIMQVANGVIHVLVKRLIDCSGLLKNLAYGDDTAAMQRVQELEKACRNKRTQIMHIQEELDLPPTRNFR